MKNKVLYTIFDRFRGPLNIDYQAIQFIAQLVAWRKISEEGKLEDGLRFHSVCDGNISPDKIAVALMALSTHDALAENTRAFELDAACLKRFSSSELSDICAVIDSLFGKNIISYRETISSLSEMVPLRLEIDEYNLSDNLGLLMLHLINPDKDDFVYCPLTTSFNLARTSAHFFENVYLETQLNTPWPWLINILEDSHIQTKIGDPVRSPSWIEDGTLKQFDVCLMNTTWNYRYKEKIDDWFDRFPKRKFFHGEVYQIYHALAQTRKRLAAIVPNNLLQRDSGGEVEFRKDLIKNNWLDAVIGGGTSNQLQRTSMPFSILILNKERTRKEVLFIDADSDDFGKQYDELVSHLNGVTYANKKNAESPDALHFCADVVDYYREFAAGKEAVPLGAEIVQPDQLEENNYNLAVKRYVISEVEHCINNALDSVETTELGKIAELIRPQAVKSQKEGFADYEFFEVSASDIPTEGWIGDLQEIVTVEVVNLTKAEKQKLKPGDVLLATKGTVGKVGIVPETYEGDWLANQSFQIIRLKKDSPINNPRVLYMYLKSEVAQDLLEVKSYGTTIPMVQKRDVVSFPVIVPSNEQQKEIVRSFEEQVRLKGKIEKLQEEIANENERHWDVK
ncbi:MAG: N-6 DNA methylase [bacterium]|nr:N-6 DNA methylase [bacterium]